MRNDNVAFAEQRKQSYSLVPACFKSGTVAPQSKTQARKEFRRATVSRLRKSAGSIGQERFSAFHSVYCVSLSAAFKNKSIQQQQDHGADDGHNPAGYVVTTSKDAANPGTYKRAGYTEQNRYDATTGIFSGH
jgi:hypothetical protein